MSTERGARPEFFTCKQHQKLAYGCRGDARRAARRHHDAGLREYPCTTFPGRWHIGHMPPMVKRGELTAAEWFDLSLKERKRRWQIEDER